MSTLSKSFRAIPVTGVEIMRRSTTKAAAAIVALSVAIPALANDGDYFIGPDGSVEYRDDAAASVSAPTSTAPLADMMAPPQVNSAAMQPVRDSVVAPAPMVLRSA